MSTTLDEISKLQQQISQLKDSAITELNARRSQLQNELKIIDAEIQTFTGKPSRAQYFSGDSSLFRSNVAYAGAIPACPKEL
jgi:peptidoglycan hydrolase CwlO-like protein